MLVYGERKNRFRQGTFCTHISYLKGQAIWTQALTPSFPFSCWFTCIVLLWERFLIIAQSYPFLVIVTTYASQYTRNCQGRRCSMLRRWHLPVWIRSVQPPSNRYWYYFLYWLCCNGCASFCGLWLAVWRLPQNGGKNIFQQTRTARTEKIGETIFFGRKYFFALRDFSETSNN